MAIQPTSGQTSGERAAIGDWNPDEFLVVLSHELRNSIGAILGWAEVVRRQPHDADLRARAVDVIKRNAGLQAKLIDQLRGFSRVNSRALPLDAQRVALVQTVEAAADAMAPLAWASSIEFEARLECPAATVLGDPALMEMAFTNLLSNAIKFTPPGGRVEVRVRCREPHAEITVSDTGRGISGEFLPYVFDRFRQQARTDEGGGLGLGLAIVRYVVEKHGGRIHAASPGEGKGATFTVTLPVEPRTDGVDARRERGLYPLGELAAGDTERTESL